MDGEQIWPPLNHLCDHENMTRPTTAPTSLLPSKIVDHSTKHPFASKISGATECLAWQFATSKLAEDSLKLIVAGAATLINRDRSCIKNYL
jgi:hypothetical protein